VKKLVIGLVLVATGCGGAGDENANQLESTKPATTTSSANAGSAACDILTQADAKSVLGREVQKLEAGGGPAGLDMCQYGYQGERMMDMGQVTVTVHPVDIGSLKKGVLDEGYQVEPVAGLGDEAFWSKDAGLYVGKGNRTAIYLAGVGGEDAAANKRRAIDLAKATSARL
jgi:hypothetical protein